MKFKEVHSGYLPEDDVEILRVAESEDNDLMFLIKKKSEEEYQLSIVLHDGREAAENHFDYESVNAKFDTILNSVI
jgi:hypothetical protein